MILGGNSQANDFRFTFLVVCVYISNLGEAESEETPWSSEAEREIFVTDIQTLATCLFFFLTDGKLIGTKQQIVSKVSPLHRQKESQKKKKKKE